jgi:hypothetical protein
MIVDYGLFSTKYTEEEPRSCQGKLDEAPCDRSISEGDVCWVDVTENRMLCEACGKCERYDRKSTQAREKAGIMQVPLIKGLDY